MQKVLKDSYKSILIYSTGYVMVKYISNVKINSVNSLYLIIDKMNGYIEASNGNKYLTVVHTDESKDTLKKIRRTVQ